MGTKLGPYRANWLRQASVFYRGQPLCEPRSRCDSGARGTKRPLGPGNPLE